MSTRWCPNLRRVTPIRDRHDIPAEYADMNGALNTKMGFELLTLTPERVVGRMPVAGNTQPYGLWHGGASCVLAETLASLGSFMHAQPETDLGRGGHQRDSSPIGDSRLGDRYRYGFASRQVGRQLRDRDQRRRRQASVYGPGHLPAGQPARWMTSAAAARASQEARATQEKGAASAVVSVSTSRTSSASVAGFTKASRSAVRPFQSVGTQRIRPSSASRRDQRR